VTAGEWYVFDGASQRGPMSHADVVEFLRGFADSDVVSVWRPGLDGWKRASHLFDIEAPTRLISAPEEVSRKRRYSLYGMYVGLSVVFCDYLFEWRGPQFKPWEGSGLGENVGHIIGAVATSVVLAFIIGGVVDFWTGRSRRKSVLDPSTFEEPEIIPEVPLDPNRRNNFIARYWRGEYSLGVSYWLFGLIGNIAVSVIVAGIVSLFRTERGYEPRAILGSIVCVWLVIILFIVWQVAGVWRSANRLIARRQAVGKRAGWATVAKVVVVLGLLSSLNTFFTSGWPQLIETSRIVFLDDPDIPDYSIRVMRNGTEAEITGGFKFGLTDDFSKILRASRQIKVVHLDSIGGRVGEAIRLNRVLKAQGVDTYVSGGCYSACTIAFAAGRNRFIRKGAVLGFHAPAFPGMTKGELESASLDQKQLFIKAGFGKSFVEKALSTPSSDMWKPSTELMAAADVITGLSDGTDFALSGFGGDLSKDRMADMLARGLPLLQAIKDRFPKDYDEIIGTYYDDYIAGKTEAESIVGARAKVLLIISTLRPLADDAVLAELGAVYADQYLALGAKSPALCYKYASGVGAKDNVAADIPASLVDKENEVNRRVVETAKKRPDVPATVVSELWKKLGTQIAVKGIRNDQLNLLTNGSVDPLRYSEYCQASATFYREIARLPSREAGILMRSMLADK
jgi:hypothetical protein